MISKTFEIRDRNTFIPALAVKLQPDNPADRYLLSRAGYGGLPEEQAAYVLLARINGGQGAITCDPYDWGSDTRTMPVAHDYIIKHFDELESGAAIDVQFILGESLQPKASEAAEGFF